MLLLLFLLLSSVIDFGFHVGDLVLALVLIIVVATALLLSLCHCRMVVVINTLLLDSSTGQLLDSVV